MAYAFNVAKKAPYYPKKPQLHVVKSNPLEQQPKFPPTEEQIACGNAMLSGANLKINAFAGCGKSTTLNYMSNLFDLVGEMWCFNARNAKEAKEKFSKKTNCLTSHAKANRELKIRENYGHKIMDERNRWANWKITREFGITACTGVTAEHVTYAALRSLRRFMYSADPEITARHCWDPLRDQSWFEKKIIENRVIANYHEHPADFLAWKEKHLPDVVRRTMAVYQDTLFGLAKDFWDAMWDMSHPMPLEHDAYLKAYQLRKPQLQGIKYLMVDEYQDTNPCVADIVNNQKYVQVIVVGDPRQAIYGFRGSVNAMEQFEGQELNLTLCHRCGETITDTANVILSHRYPGLPPMRGNPKINSTLGPIDPTQPYTVLSRSNAALFSEAIKAVSAQKTIHVIGGLKDAINRALSVYGVSVNNRDMVKHPEIKLYEDWDMLVKESEFDADINRYVKLIKDYGDEIPQICAMMENAGESRDAEKADVILSTVHRSKGFEFKQVRILDDFRLEAKQDEDNEPYIEGTDEEFNCLYIAATRAIQRLELNEIGQTMLEMG